MPPKKGKKGKGKKKRANADIINEPDNFKSLNVSERKVLQQLYDKMRVLKAENEAARATLMKNKGDEREINKNRVSPVS